MRKPLLYALAVAALVGGGSLYVSQSTQALCEYEHDNYPVEVKRYQVIETFLESAARARAKAANVPGTNRGDVLLNRQAEQEYLSLKARNDPPKRPRC